jgi:tRNA threonylcarbamoyl adenosine modification protein (Sua5/YciO/YrdC/YwlC family)
MIIEINPNNIDDRLIQQAVDVLKKGGLLIFPTDSVYAIGVDLYNKKALENLARFKGIKLNKARFSIICSNLSEVSKYVKQIDRPIFKVMKQNLPGPFTFILTATNEIPRLFDSNRREIGVRIPDNPIVLRLAEAFEKPIATTSLGDEEDEIMEYINDPSEIYQRLDDKVDLIIDGGIGNIYASTVVDCTNGNIEIVRQGIGELID